MLNYVTNLLTSLIYTIIIRGSHMYNADVSQTTVKLSD